MAAYAGIVDQAALESVDGPLAPDGGGFLICGKRRQVIRWFIDCCDKPSTPQVQEDAIDWNVSSMLWSWALHVT